MTGDTDGAGGAAGLRILRGEPTDQEIAALVAVLAVLGAGDAGSDRVQPRLRHRHGRHHHRNHHRSTVSWRGQQS